MISFSLTRERKYILIGGAILLFLGLVYKTLPLFHGIFDGSAQIAAKEKQLARYQRSIEEGKELKTRLVALTSALEQGESGLLTGRTPSLAAVDMQNILNTITQKSGMEMQSVRVLKATKQEGAKYLNTITQKSGMEIQSVRVLKATKQEGAKYLSIPVTFSIVLTTRQLKEILYRIETFDKYLTVHEITIDAPLGKGREQLRVNMTVNGFTKESEK